MQLPNFLSHRLMIPVAALLLSSSTALHAAEVSNSDTRFYYRKAQAQLPATHDCEVAVYGGTPAGVAAAIQAARMGRKTLLLSFNRHVGGMTSGGLTATDVGNKESIGGLALDFYTRIGRFVDFSPSAAESLYLTMLQEAGVTVLLGQSAGMAAGIAIADGVAVQDLDYEKLKQQLIAAGQRL